MFRSGSWVSTLSKATPIVLAALAVAVPARAGLTNVGGEAALVSSAVLGQRAWSSGSATRSPRACSW